MSTLKNKLAIVTGGNSGIGFAAAQEMVNQGADVIITGRNQSAVAEAAKRLGKNTTGLLADAGKLTDIDALAKHVKDLGRKVDILFINAGVASFSPIEHVTEEHFDTITDINYKGAFFTFSRLIPFLNENSSVIFLTSVNATSGMPNTAIYAASKAALHSLVKVAATEMSPKRIRVNAISPGPISTPLFGKVGLDEQSIQHFATAMQARIPLKRFGTAEEVAKLVAFVSSDDAAFITGAEFVIDGGINVNPILG
jgi:NAD(P)-dependent dehydrogenase (short-subunit alcohol dehydrogenase family)